MDKQIKVAAIDDFPLFHEGVSVIMQNMKDITFTGFFNRDYFQKTNINGSTDILLFNSTNPLINEITLLEKIRAGFPRVKILVFMDNDDEKYFRKMLEAGVSGFLMKSVDGPELEYAISILSNNKSYYSHKLSTQIFEKMFNKAPSNGNFKPYESINLTNRELEVLYLICHEYTNEEIADKLYISPRTVGGHRNSLMNKIGARNTAGLVKYAMENSLFKEGSKLVEELQV